MRINVYSQELTEEIQVEEKVSNTGLIYTGVRFMLHSSDMLHHPPQDDDRSGDHLLAAEVGRKASSARGDL